MDIYLRDLTNPANPKTVLLTGFRFTFPIPEFRGDSFGAEIAGFGACVAFTSTAQDLVVNPADANGNVRDVFRVRINEDGSAGLVDIVSVAEFAPNFNPAQTTNPMVTADSFGIGGGSSPTCPNDPIASPASGCQAPPPSGCTLVGNLAVGRVISDDGCRILMQGAPLWTSSQDVSLCTDPNINTSCNNNCSCTVLIQQVYLRDMCDFTPLEHHTFLVSKISRTSPNVGCFPGNGCSRRASISGDGKRVVFSSTATNLLPSVCDTECFEDVFVVDVDRMVIGLDQCVVPTRVSVRSCGAATVDGPSFQPAVSSDGMLVGFASQATNLLSGTPCPDTNGLRDIFIRNVSTASTRRFDVDSNGAQSSGGNSSNPDMTGDGNVAVYESLATNLVSGDTNGKQDICETFSPQGPFIRGDANGDGQINISDSVFISNWLGDLTKPPPPCYDAADADDSGLINISDIQRINGFLFQGGPPPLCPWSCSATTSCCGKDPTADGLPCGQALSGCTQFSGSAPPPPVGTCANCPQ